MVVKTHEWVLWLLLLILSGVAFHQHHLIAAGMAVTGCYYEGQRLSRRPWLK